MAPGWTVATVFAEFRRVLRPGGPLLVGFHEGTGSRLKTEGYGGHPMKVHVHRRQPEQLESWLVEAGFTIEARLTLTSPESRLGGILFAHRNDR